LIFFAKRLNLYLNFPYLKVNIYSLNINIKYF